MCLHASFYVMSYFQLKEAELPQTFQETKRFLLPVLDIFNFYSRSDAQRWSICLHEVGKLDYVSLTTPGALKHM